MIQERGRLPHLNSAQVGDRLRSAQIRLDELLLMRGQGERTARLSGADGRTRLQIVQEFFFHLLGAVEVVAQIVNDRRDLRIDQESATIGEVCKQLRQRNDNLLATLGGLCQQVKNRCPVDPYDEDGLIFRAFLYRHTVTHRHMSPFLFRLGGGSDASLLLDPRIAADGANSSNWSAQNEMSRMLEVVRRRCVEALATI